jgi:serine/threonine-protein kinase RsbW
MRLRLVLQLAPHPRSVGIVRRTLDRALDEAGLDDEQRDDLRLAVNEACTNVIDHAADADFDVRLTVDDRSCVVEVADCGPGLTGTTPDERPVSDIDAETGRGLAIIRTLTDRLELFPRNPRGLTVRLVKHLT